MTQRVQMILWATQHMLVHELPRGRVQHSQHLVYTPSALPCKHRSSEDRYYDAAKDDAQYDGPLQGEAPIA